MDEATRTSIETFVSRYETLVIATEHKGQPYATRIFFVEDAITETTVTLYGTLITNSRKLANLQHNPQVGIFIGPDQPSAWMEATAHARVVHHVHASPYVWSQGYRHARYDARGRREETGWCSPAKKTIF